MSELTAKQVYEIRRLLRPWKYTYGEIYDQGHDPLVVVAIERHLTGYTAAKAARYWRRHLSMLTMREIIVHFRSKR